MDYKVVTYWKWDKNPIPETFQMWDGKIYEPTALPQSTYHRAMIKAIKSYQKKDKRK